MASLYIGTSAFTAAGWEGSFYPEGTRPADFLRYYAQHFNSVEIDSTFYRIPSEATVQGWAKKTPEGFMFAAKVPQVITHEKVLVDCDAEFKQFVEVMDILSEKLGPLLLQFGYFNHESRIRGYPTRAEKDSQERIPIFSVITRSVGFRTRDHV